MEPTEDRVIVTPVQAAEAFNGGMVCTFSPNEHTTLQNMCGGRPHARREIDIYLEIGTSPLYQMANNK